MLTFEPIQLNRRGEYLEYYRQCLEKASDYSFVNIWSWAGKYQYEWAWADDLVWLRYRYGPLYFYGAPIGAWQRDDWQKLLAENLEPHFIMTRVPETLSRIIETQMPDIVGKNQREHWEYLYNINDLIELKGSDYAAKRKLANTFERRYAYEFRPLQIQDFPAVRTFMKGWIEQQGQRRDINTEDFILENQAINRLFESWKDLPEIVSGSIWINNGLAAFTIGEIVDPQTVIIHFEKASLDFIGIYQAINRRMLMSLPENITCVNREQDLGLPGLRKAKTEYRPVDFIRKQKLMYQINTQE